MGSSDEVARGYVLWLGDEALPREALSTRGVRVERAPARHPARNIEALAPDLVVLSGASAARASELAALHAVVVIEAAPPSAPIERCWGVVARIEDGLPQDVLAERIDALLRRLAARAHAALTLAPSEVEPFVAQLAGEGRAGVLLCGSPPGAVAMTPDGARAPDVSELLRRTADRAELSLRFFELRPGRMKILSAASELEVSSTSARLEGLAALVVDAGGGVWEKVAEALRAAGASVKLVAARPDAIERARSADPALIVVPSTALATPAGRLLLEDSRFGSAALVVIAPEQLPIAPGRLHAVAGEVCAAELAARARAQGGAATIERIEALGPARWIKAMARSPVRMRLRSITGHGEIVFAEGKITDATFEPSEPGASTLRGAAALPALVALTHGTLLVGPSSAEPAHERPAVATPAVRVPPPGKAMPRTAAAPVPSSEPTGAPVIGLPPRAGEPVAASRIESPPRAHEPVGASRIESPPRAHEPSAASRIESPPRAHEPSAASRIESPPRASEPMVAPAIGAASGAASSSPARSWSRVLAWCAAGAAVSAGVYVAVDRFVPVRAQPDAPGTVVEVSAPPRLESGASRPDVSEPTLDAPDIAAPDPDAPEAVAAAEPDIEVPTADAPVVAQLAADGPEAAMPAAEPSHAPAGVSDRARVAALVLQSDEAMRRREYQRGLALAQEALAIDPRHPRAAYDAALALLRLRRDDEALEWAEHAMGWEPTEPLYPLLVGDIHQQNGRHARARAAWRRCLSIDPPLSSCERRLELADARDATR